MFGNEGKLDNSGTYNGDWNVLHVLSFTINYSEFSNWLALDTYFLAYPRLPS